MAYLVPFHELLAHGPEMDGGRITGCKGCRWVVSNYNAQPAWTQFLMHLPHFRVEGYLNLSDEDVRWLQKMSEVF